MLQIGLELLGQIAVERRPIGDGADLVVQEEAAVVEVGRADDGDVVVHHQGLGVQHARLVLVDAHAAADQLVVVGARGRRDQGRVRTARHQQLHIDTAQRGIGECGQRGLGGHEVRRGQPDTFLGRVDGRQMRAVDGLQAVVGAGGDDLHGQRAFGSIGQQQVYVFGFVLGVLFQRIGPVFQEDGLQPVDHGAFQAQMDIVVGIDHDARVLFIGNVDTAREANLAIAHQNLAVGAEVDDRAQAPADLGAMEHRDLGARLFQRLQKAPAQLLGAQRIEQQAHLYACAGPLYQQVAQGRAGLVRLEDVVLQVDVVARRIHRLDDGVEGGSAAHQQPQVCGRAHGKVAGGRHQPRDLVQALRAARHALAQALHAGSHTRCLARTQPLDALALEPLRAEEVVNGQPAHGDQRHGQQPAQRGHRRTALQKNPHRHNHHVDRPGEGQQQQSVLVGQMLAKPIHRYPLERNKRKSRQPEKAVGLCNGHQKMHINRQWPLWARPARKPGPAWAGA